MKFDLKIFCFALFLFVLFLLISCSPKTSSIIKEKQCFSDTDCVPAQCCHPTDAVNKDFAPDCSETFCTMECASGTLDCGQGEVKCLEGECNAVISKEIKLN